MKPVRIPILLCLLLTAAAGCQPWPPGQQPPLGSGPAVGNGGFAGSWNGGWNRNWNTATASTNQLQAATDRAVQQATQQADQRIAELNQRLTELQSQVGGFDTDNSSLHVEIAQLQQQLQRANDANFQLRQQLGQMASSVQQLQTVRGQLEQQLTQAQGREQQLLANRNSTSQVPAQQAGATLRANNSLLQRLPQLRIDGAQTRMDGDVIRVELPSERIFVAGSYQTTQQANQMLSSLVASIQQNFPQQYISIEAHWDQSPLNAGLTAQQVTATQALAIYNQLIAAGLPQRQLFTVAMASNRPRYQGNNSLNRRIEIVIYPETY